MSSDGGDVLKVEERVWTQLQGEAGKSDPTRTLFLVGSDQTNTVVGCVKLGIAEGEAWTEEHVRDMLAMLPVGITCLGVFVAGEDARTEAEKIRGSGPTKLLKSQGNGRSFFVLSSNCSAACRVVLDKENGSHLAELSTEVVVVPDELKTKSGYLRCALDVPLQVIFSAEEERNGALERAVETAAANIASNAFEFLYNIPKEEGGFASGFLATSLDELSKVHGNGKVIGTHEGPLDLELYASSSSNAAPVAPVLKYEPSDGNFECEQVEAHLDVVVLQPREAAFGEETKRAITSKMLAQLESIKQMYQRCFRVYRVHHFSLSSHLVSIVYPADTEDEKLHKRRLALHEMLLLPLDRPLLRFSNALTWNKDLFSKKLINVHEALGGSGVKDGKVYAVQGKYTYFHYLQDCFDDAGWGCAYRSLQTIISWFILNKYTNVDVPTHRAIQETLVRIGDKPPSFVGGRQWIGSFEISYVLDTLLGVTSKVLTFNSGEEIPTKAREIAQHFSQEGTPIMIGGGVLAYTLLGIDYNDLTGECAFLILDPHYTEGEEIKKICAGGWVGWKRLGDKAAAGGDLFVKNAFYNFLCPQRPRVV